MACSSTAVKEHALSTLQCICFFSCNEGGLRKKMRRTQSADSDPVGCKVESERRHH